MALPSSSPDAPSAATTTTAAAARPLFSNPQPQPQPQPLPLTNVRSSTTPLLHTHPLPLPLPLVSSHPHYQQHQTQPKPPYKPQPHPSRVSPGNSIHQQLAPKQAHPDPPPQPHGILYPVSIAGGGFLPKQPLRPDQSQTVTVANSGGFPPRPAVAGYPHHQVRPFGFVHSDPSLPQASGPNMHLMRPTILQQAHLGSPGGILPGMIKNAPAFSQPKVAPSSSKVPDRNGYNDSRDRSKEGVFATVRDRKVRMVDGASLYALCRSWLRNGIPEESQPQHMDSVMCLPRPLPIPVEDVHSPVPMEGGKEEEEDEESVVYLSSEELLQKHVKRAKRVRARLREVRLERIARYKARLALLLPPIGDQHLPNDTEN